MRVQMAVLVLLVSGVAAGPAASDPDVRLVGGVIEHTVVKGESLRTIGSRFGVDPATIAAENGLRINRPLPVGQVLTIDHRHLVPAGVEPGSITINVPQRLLFFNDGTRVFHAPVAAGSRGWQTPLGPFRIILKETDPTWDVPPSIAAEARAKGQTLPAKVPPGPKNPLGKHWLGLSLGSVGIHGTNAPSSIYQTVTHGCIRVHPDDVAVLFDLVEVGTPGRIVYEPILLAEANGEIWLEVHADVYRRNLTPALGQVREAATALGLEARIDWAAVATVIAARHGIARVVTARPGE